MIVVMLHIIEKHHVLGKLADREGFSVTAKRTPPPPIKEHRKFHARMLAKLYRLTCYIKTHNLQRGILNGTDGVLVCWLS